MNQEKLEVKLFPNPTMGTSKITWNLDRPVAIKVFDMSGSIIQQKEMGGDKHQAIIDIEQNRIYFIVLEQEGQKTWSGKLAKMQ